MAELYDKENRCIGELPISPQQHEKLCAGETITVSFHTPRMLIAKIGACNGTLELSMVDGHLTTLHADQLERYRKLQAAIKEARDA
jgi:hypothetical protein